MDNKVYNVVDIFDMDGTILDSMPLWDGAEFRYIYTLPGVDLVVVDALKEQTKDMDMKERYEYFYKVLKVESLNDKVVDYVISGYETVKPFPGAIDYIRYCKQKGHKIAIATSNFRKIVVYILELLGIIDLFDIIVCNDDFAERTGANKNKLYDQCVKLTDSHKVLSVIYEDSEIALEHAYEERYTNLIYRNSEGFVKCNKKPLKVIKSFTELKTDPQYMLSIERHVSTYGINELALTDSPKLIKLARLNKMIVPMTIYLTSEVFFPLNTANIVTDCKMRSVVFCSSSKDRPIKLFATGDFGYVMLNILDHKYGKTNGVEL